MPRLVSSFQIAPGSIAETLDKTFGRLEQLHFAEALWSRDVEMWTADPDARRSIANRLGWLDAIDMVAPQLPRLRAFAASIRDGAFTDVVLLGMGGSSLAPEVIRQVVGVVPGFPRFRMLDSVDPDAVREAMSDAPTSLFILASKSGGTIEPNSMAAEARRRIEAADVGDWGSRFVAITDEGTALHQRARRERFRDLFVNPSNIGGRYSALSFFGLVPAALMGIDLEAFTSRAHAMAKSCRNVDVRGNPGLALGAVMAAATIERRDKLTLLLPPRLSSLGLWVEQLVAESTGKNGIGVVPITGEAPDTPDGADRFYVAVHLGEDSPDAARRERIRASGAPIMDVHVPDIHALGAEFFRWEVATAAAGRLLDINPFDEPNVQQAKDATNGLLATYSTQRRLPTPEPATAVSGLTMTVSAAAQELLNGAPPERFLSLARPSDYVGLLAYLPSNDAVLTEILSDARRKIGNKTACATMLGYGPRYLHSTGQLHKGGANNGVFIIISAPADEDLPVPGAPYSFGVLENAQAIGDFMSLDRTHRRAILLRLPDRTSDTVRLAFRTLMP
ncbi:MAG: glucose-6-phosphate isomerase [Vicinamibacterales bacterium]